MQALRTQERGRQHASTEEKLRRGTGLRGSPDTTEPSSRTEVHHPHTDRDRELRHPPVTPVREPAAQPEIVDPRGHKPQTVAPPE